MSNDADGAPAAVQSVDRALSILTLLAARGDLRITEIAGALAVHKSTAFRLVATLERHDLVEQYAERGKYRLGVGVLRLAGASSARLDLVQESRPVSSRLAVELDETINVAVLSGGDALYLDQVAPPSGFQLHNWVGQRIPLHATSNGKVLLAHVPAARLDELTAVLRPFTDRTITDRARLWEELETVRRRGYAVAVDELEIGLTAVAAPVTGPNGIVIASLSASGPSYRMPPSRHDDVARRVVAAAEEVSRRLGWHGAPPRRPVPPAAVTPQRVVGVDVAAGGAASA
jgi:DNA-binding IclR family transcriptional regulator